MKKIIILSLISVFSLLTITGCKKENKPEEFTLIGKTFAAFNYHFLDEDVYTVWRFVSETEVERTSRRNSPQGGLIGNIYYGTYILDYPNLNVSIPQLAEYKCEFISETCFRTQWYNTSGKIEIHEFHLQ